MVKSFLVCVCSDTGSVVHVLAHCLWQLSELRSDTSGPMARLHWFLELLGHTRNVATGVVPLSSQAQTLNKVWSKLVTLRRLHKLVYFLWCFSPALLTHHAPCPLPPSKNYWTFSLPYYLNVCVIAFAGCGTVSACRHHGCQPLDINSTFTWPWPWPHLVEGDIE
jgi:hypothetical protein